VTGSYAYSGYLWPSLASATLVALLGWYGWRRRKVTGALPFSFGCLFAVAWALGAMLETAAVEPEAKIMWLRFLTLWQLPVVTAATCFALQYAGFSRWLSRRALMLLAAPPLLFMVLILTDHLHHLVWSSFAWDGVSIDRTLAPTGSAFLVYSYLLSLFNTGVLVWLFARSPRHRRPVALMLLGAIGGRLLFQFAVVRTAFPNQWDLDPFVLVVVFGMYAIALFRFRVFDPLPAAREAAIAQMLEGMLVLDLQGHIVDANRAAERILGETADSLRGRTADEVLPVGAGLVGEMDGGATAESDFDMGSGTLTRHYTMESTPLRDKQGYELGRLLMLHDVTEQKRAQARVLEQERAVAILQERERLARELHDSVGQVLGYVSLQAQTIQKRLHDDGDGQKVDSLLARLAEVAQDAHADVRGSILDLKAGSSEDWSFLPTLGRYFESFHLHYGVHAELLLGDGVDDDTFEPGVAAQLFRAIQEALANARRHGDAGTVRVSIGRYGDEARITVADDGRGFDSARLDPEPGSHFGLAFMRERMAQIGGNVEIDSRQGAGTRVILGVPLSRKEGESGESTSG
jgi:signal transduction histidine kinase